jgi:ribosomal protein L37AE/L43A
MGESDRHSIERFDPLLRDLIAWGLVTEGSGTAKPTWRLTAAAQRRLTELAKPARPLHPDQLVYLDHHCSECRARGRTRLRHGLYLCDTCLDHHAPEGAAAGGGTGAEAPTPTPVVAKSHWRRSRPGDDGTKPLAG